MAKRRRKQRPRRRGTTASTPAPTARTPEPAWSVRRWGAIRIAVVVLAAATMLGVGALNPSVFLAEQEAFWTIVGIGGGAAGLVSALRLIAFPVDAVLLRTRAPWELELIGLRTLGDAGVMILTVVVAMVVRTAVIVAGAGWTAEIVQSFLLAPVASFIVFASLLIVGWLLVLAIGGLVRLARRRRIGERIPASVWWILVLVSAVALAVPATFALGLGDTTSVPMEGGDAIAAFYFGNVELAQPWQYIALWIARLGTLIAAIGVVGVIISRMRERPRA